MKILYALKHIFQTRIKIFLKKKKKKNITAHWYLLIKVYI